MSRADRAQDPAPAHRPDASHTRRRARRVLRWAGVGPALHRPRDLQRDAFTRRTFDSRSITYPCPVSTEQADAVAVGGPLDGQVLGQARADHFDVTMADRTRYRYVRRSPRDGATDTVPIRLLRAVALAAFLPAVALADVGRPLPPLEPSDEVMEGCALVSVLERR